MKAFQSNLKPMISNSFKHCIAYTLKLFKTIVCWRVNHLWNSEGCQTILHNYLKRNWRLEAMVGSMMNSPTYLLEILRSTDISHCFWKKERTLKEFERVWRSLKAVWNVFESHHLKDLQTLWNLPFKTLSNWFKPFSNYYKLLQTHSNPPF